MSNIVHVVGTGTIGEPLIGLLAGFKKELGIDEVTFSKRTPLLTDRTKVWELMKLDAKLCVERGENEKNWKKFEDLDMHPTYDFEEGIARATVVIDCTPEGNKNKEKYYEKYRGKVKGFLAQGSEKGFGRPYAYTINDFDPAKDDCVQVVSCNTHNIAAVIKTLAMDSVDGKIVSSYLDSGRFNCIRRGRDMSEEKGIVPAPQAEKHDKGRYGTHQAEDAADLFATIGYGDLDIFSSAMKVNSQYMHAIWFDLRLKKKTALDEVHSKIRDNPMVAQTYKDMTSLVCSFGRDHGHYGRIMDQTVFVLPSLTVIGDGYEVIGFSFTPQDGNSLLSSVAATETYLLGKDWEKDRGKDLTQTLESCLFKEI